MLLYALFILLFLSTEKPFIRWEVCDNESKYLLHDLKISFSTDEPHRGKLLEARINAELEEEINPGEYTAEYKVNYGLLVIRSRKMDVCQALQEASKWIQGIPTCPISKGLQNLLLVSKVPIELPMGKYTMKLNAYRNNEKQSLICINAQAYFGLC